MWCPAAHASFRPWHRALLQLRGKASHGFSTPAHTPPVPLLLASAILFYGRVAPRMAHKAPLLERSERISDLPVAGMLARTCFPAPPSKGTWCSGITPAQHAGGPGFNPQCVQYFHLFSAAVSQLKAKSLECVSSCALRVLVSQADVSNTHVREGRHAVAAIDHCGVCPTRNVS